MTERYNCNINATSLSSTLGNLIITSGSLKATFNNNTIGNLYTTGGNVGIANVTPAYALDVTGNIKTSNYVLQPNIPSFRVYFNGNYTSLITNGTVLYNNGSYYSTSNGRFTAPVSGYYVIRLQLTCPGSAGPWAAVCINSSTFTNGNAIIQPLNSCQQTLTNVYYLNANDYICAAVQSGTLSGDGNSGFGAALLATTA